MKNYKKILGLITLVAMIAVAFAPQAQAKKKRDRKNQAIEDLLRQGNECYEAGNYEEAVSFFEQAHKKGNIKATNNLAICYSEGQGVTQNQVQAFKLFEKAAKKGYVDAQVSLGTMYKNGYGCKQDYKAAIKWLEKAAAQGDSDAMYLIASCYFYGGYGIKKDIAKAKEWMQKSADAGNETAIDNLPKIK